MARSGSAIAILLLIVRCDAFKYDKILYNEEVATADETCLVKYITRIFDNKIAFTYRNTHDARDLAQLVVNSIQSTGKIGHNVEVITRQKFQCSGLGNWPQTQYVMIVKGQDLQHFLNNYLCFEWPLTSRFIFVRNISDDGVDEILKGLRHFLIFKATLVTSWNETTLTYYRARPRCVSSDYVDVPVTYHCSSNDDRHLEPYADVRTFPKCDFKMGVRIAAPYIIKNSNRSVNQNINRPYSGIEMQIIRDVLGTEPTVDGVGRIIIRDLVRKKLDFIGGALSINEYYHVVVNSYPFIFTSLVAVVKKPHLLNWFSMYRIFSLELWLLLGAAIVAIALIACLVQSCCEGAWNLHQIDTIFLAILNGLFGKSMVIGRRYFRLLFLAWIWFTFVLRSSYEAQSVLKYNSVDAVQKLSALDELCAADYKIFTSVLVYPYFHRGLQLPSCFLRYERFVSVKDPMLALHITDSPHVVAFMYKLTYTLNLGRFVNAIDQEPFYVIQETLYFFPFVFYFHRADPLLSVFQRRGSMMFESGLTAYIEKKFENANRNRVEAVTQSQETDQRRISMMDTKVLFYLYGCGVLIACIVFVLENMYCHYVNKYREWLQVQLRDDDE